MIKAYLIKGNTITSYKSISTDLKNAGANWNDEEVITDGNLTTYRNPDDLPAFNKELSKSLEVKLKDMFKNNLKKLFFTNFEEACFQEFLNI